MISLSPQVKNTLITVGKVVFCVMTAIVACPVSLVALPVIGAKTLVSFTQHHFLYQKTMTNQTRGLFGRLPNQDYTRWNGSTLQAGTNRLSESLRKHEEINFYVHGAVSSPFNPSAQSPFKNVEDLNWLDKEFTRRSKYDSFQKDLTLLRICLKSLFPFGLIWVVFSEYIPSNTNASPTSCHVCNTQNLAATHWKWQNAINFHRINLKNQLGL